MSGTTQSSQWTYNQFLVPEHGITHTSREDFTDGRRGEGIAWRVDIRYLMVTGLSTIIERNKPSNSL